MAITKSLYKAFRPNAKPRFETVMKVMNALRLQLNATPRLQVGLRYRAKSKKGQATLKPKTGNKSHV